MSDLSLEIYHLDVHGGDSTAIIVKDLGQEPDKGGKTIYSMLIDAGSEGKGSAYLKAYLEKYLTLSFDCIIATHYHQDHIQGFKQAEIKFKKFLDNGAYPDRNGKVFTPRNDIGSGARTSIFDAYKAQVQNQMEAERIAIPFIEQGFDLKTAKPLELLLGATSGITLTCYCANGILAKGDDVLGNQRIKKNKPISPNDVSLAFVLEWGDFRYFTAGDLSGDRAISSYYNIEEDLMNYLINELLKDKKKITVFKASHHGSEHSNHGDLLNSFQPETIIVCCNIMKQVPSPVFLERLDTYFKTNANANAVFTNTLRVFKNDDRYMPLQTIKGSIASGNVKFEGMGDGEEVATNLGIKCAIVRRRLLDGKHVPYDDKTKPAGMTVINKTGYDILLPLRDDQEATDIGNTVKFRSYNLSVSWDVNDLHNDYILEGFTSQAEAIVEWITKDKTQTEKQGMNYIQEYYPGLVKIITDVNEGELEGKLVNEMVRMFNESFTQGTIDQNDFVPNPNNQLTSDQKLTFYMIMINNYHQAAFNTAIKYKNTRHGSYDVNNSWNRLSYPEPYSKSTSGDKEKRRMVYTPTGRFPKRGNKGNT
jgi:hypothetical protein